MINKLGQAILYCLIVLTIFKWVQSDSPCSAWSKFPERCSSDISPSLK